MVHTKLGNVAKILTGMRPGGEGGTERRPLLNVRDLDDGRTPPREALEPTTLTERQALSAERYEVRTGDILLSCRGTIDKVALVGPETAGALASVNLLIVRPDPTQLDPRVLFAFLFSAPVAARLNTLATGTTIRGIHQRDVANLEIALPNIEEQRQLGDLIESAEDQYRAGIELSHARRTLGHETALACLMEASR